MTSCRAIAAQLDAGDCLLVVDNASTDGTSEMVRSEFPGAELLTLSKNVGGAGGFSEGMKWAYERGFGFTWIMDDDGVPHERCLSALRVASGGVDVAVPVQRDCNDRLYGLSIWRGRNIDVTSEILTGLLPKRGAYLFTFVGPLIPRQIIERIGLPNSDFFIWFDDHEYSLRLAETVGERVVAVPEAIFDHDMGTNSRSVSFLGIRSIRSDVTPWKLYYGIRNPLYTLLHRRKSLKELLLFSAVQTRLVLMDLVYGPDRRERFYWRFLGIRDGVIGRMGRRH